jgi:uncharacterized damage-inducible protein DinB
MAARDAPHRNGNGPLTGMLHYNAWATNTLVDFCRGLSDQQLDTRAPGASGSVRELLLHLVGAQQTNVLRTKGRHHEGELHRQSQWPGFDDLCRLAAESGDALLEIAEQADLYAEVELQYRGDTSRWPRSFFLIAAVEHGVEHRTEIKLTLEALGIETPNLDAWWYAAANNIGYVVADV